MYRILLFVAAWIACVSGALAHEVRPTIGDLSAQSEGVRLELQLNVEAFVAGIDLDGLEDTNVAPQADDYDRLRALSPQDLEAEFAQTAARMADEIRVMDGDTALALSVAEVDVGPTGDPEALRDSRVIFTAPAANSGTLDVIWPAGYGTLILRQMGVDDGFTGYLDGGDSSGAITITGGDQAGAFQTFTRYIPVGFDHIVPKGLDHILFVLGLFFLSLRLGALLWQVTAFTLAHTVTLALGALGLVTVPGSIVEPIIAASIVYVAIENIVSPKMTPWRPFVVFVFGLLHGLGFASVLGEFGLPTGQFIPALIGFNIGVELGQLAVIAVAYLLVGYWFGDKPWYRRAIAIPASLVIAAIGAYWVIERTLL
ncbi:HupE/UreJ family protein [Roseobacteraceae bacterium S113]